MARLRRHYIPGIIHHAISRFHGGDYRLRDQDERDEYLRWLGMALGKSDWRLLAFALMSTHIHLVLLAGLAPPGSLFQAAHTPFARWLNARQRTIGRLFAGRFRLWAVKRPAAELIAYVHNNPVRANVVAAAANSSWTSHRHYLEPATAPAWLDVSRGMELAGFPCRSSFDQYVRSVAGQPREPIWRGELDNGVLARLRHSGGVAMELAEPIIADGAAYRALIRPRGFAEARGDYSPEQIIDAVERALGVERNSFRGRSKTPLASRGRRLALRIWRSMRGSQAEMCAALGMSESAACQLLKSSAGHHRPEDEERVWLELLRCYPQRI